MGKYITDIEDLTFYKGDTTTITFEFHYEDGWPIALSDLKAEVYWTLCPYGQYEHPVLKKKMQISDLEHHVCTVTLTAEETKGLEDIKFSHQPIVVYGKREYRRAEGDLILSPWIVDN